jgi:hypothetical protein
MLDHEQQSRFSSSPFVLVEPAADRRSLGFAFHRPVIVPIRLKGFCRAIKDQSQPTIAETKNPIMRVAASIPLGPTRLRTFFADARNRYVVNIVATMAADTVQLALQVLA